MPVLVKAIQEQQDIITDNIQQVEKTRQENMQLRLELEAVRERLAIIETLIAGRSF